MAKAIGVGIKAVNTSTFTKALKKTKRRKKSTVIKAKNNSSFRL